MTRIAAVFVFCSMLLSVATAQAADKDKTMKAWETLVGEWVSPRPDGTLSSLSASKTESGCILIQAQDSTIVIGWDEAEEVSKATGFTIDGFFVHKWKLTGDGPTFSGTSEKGEKLKMEFTAKDRYELTIGDQKSVGERKE